MPIKDKEVLAFYEELLKDGNLSDDERKSLEALVEKLEPKFKSGVHAQKSYNSKMDELRTKETQLESQYSTKMREVEGLKTQVANSDGLTKKENESLRRRLEKAQNEALKVHQELSKYDDGIEFLKGVGWDDAANIRFNEGIVDDKDKSKSNTNPDNKSKSEIDYEARLKELQQNFNRDMGYMADFVTFLPMAQIEYKQLHGTDLDVNDFKSKIQAAAKTNPNMTFQDVFDTSYEMPELREKKRQEDFDKLVAKRVEEELAKKTSDLGIPTDQQVNFGSEFYKAVESTRPKENPNSEVHNDLIRRNETVSEAVQHFRQSIAGKDFTA